MPTHERLGTDDGHDLQHRRKPSIQLDKEPTVVVGEQNAAMHLTPQHGQLMSKRRVLGFSRLFDLKGEAKTARRKQNNPNIVLLTLGDTVS